jgi:hypothetical protein
MIGQPGHGHRLAPRRDHARQSAVLQPLRLGVGRVDLDERLGRVAAEVGRQARAGHGVPLVADAAGVQRHRIDRIHRVGRSLRLDRDHARAAVRGLEAAIDEQARRALPVRRHGPLDRQEIAVSLWCQS